MALAKSVPLTDEHYNQMPAFKMAIACSTESNDCGVIALSIAAEIPYYDAHKMLEERGREPGGSTNFGILKDALRTWFTLREEFYGFSSDKRLEDVCNELPDTGTHLIYTDEHVMVYKDGNLEDWYRFAIDVPPILGTVTLERACLTT